MTVATVDLIQKRRNHRYPCDFQVELESGNQLVAGRALDFGAGGMRLQTDRPVPKGSIILVDGIPYEKGLRHHRPAAQVAWVGNRNDCETVEIGIRFFQRPAFFEAKPHGFEPQSDAQGLRTRIPVQVQEPTGELLNAGWVVQLGRDRLVFQSDEYIDERGSVRLVIGPLREKKMPGLLAGAILEDVRITSPAEDGQSVGLWESEFRLVSVPERQRALLGEYLSLLSKTPD